MFAILSLATLICVGTFAAIGIGRTGAGQVEWVGFDGPGVLVGFGLYVAAAQFWGNAFAVSLMAAFLLHEMGHVLAVRLASSGNARFRLTPILSGRAVSEKRPVDDAEMFFVALMGAGFSLAPMAMALVLSLAMRPVYPEMSDFLLVFGTTIGALNFIMLLPFPMMDGGKCARVAVRNFWPALAPGLTIFMVAAMGTAGVRHGSVALLLVAAVGAYSLFTKPEATRHPMKPDQGLVALAAYAFTIAAHFSAGWLLISLLV